MPFFSLKPRKDPASKPDLNLLNFGWSLTVGVVFFSLGGYYIDQKRGGGIFWTITGLTLGMFYIGYELWKIVRKINESDKK